MKHVILIIDEQLCTGQQTNRNAQSQCQEMGDNDILAVEEEVQRCCLRETCGCTTTGATPRFCPLLSLDHIVLAIKHNTKARSCEKIKNKSPCPKPNKAEDIVIPQR